MQIAINEQGKEILIASQSSKQINDLRQEKFICPHCFERVIIRAGPKTIPHFSHQRLSNCTSHKGESDYHERGKLLMYQWLKRQQLSVQLEPYLQEIKQIPDILLTINNKNIAIEFQCSKISPEIINKRNQGYQQLKITPIWILGAKLLKRYNHKQFKIDFFTSHFIHRFPKLPQNILFYFCPHTEQFQIINHLYFVSPNRAIAKLKIKKLPSTAFTNLFDFSPLNQRKLFTIWLEEKQRFRLNYSKMSRNELNWQKWLYDRGLFKENLPSYIYLPTTSQYLFKVPPWQWQTKLIILIIDPLPVGGSFTLEHLTKLFNQQMYHRKQFPLIRTNHHPIKEYLRYLISIDLINEISGNHYIKKQQIQFYQNIEEAIFEDKRLIDYLKRFM